MLPDLPSFKNDIQLFIDKYLNKQVHSKLGVFNESPKHFVHEGNRMRVIRADGSIQDSGLKEASAQISLNLDEVPGLTVEKRIEKLNGMADEMAKQISQHLFGSLNDVLEKAGQTTDNKGRPFDADAFFEAIEKIQYDFDENGNPNKISMVVHPSLAPKAQEVFNKIDSDPGLKSRYMEIMEKKKWEWRDREASRKLVG